MSAALIGPLATIFSAAAAGVFATIAIKTNREIARQKATIDLIEKSESSEYYRGLSKVFRDRIAAKSPLGEADIAHIVDPKSDEDVDLRTKIAFFLNHYELIATGFEFGVIDKSFYAAFMRGSVVHDWSVARPVIDGLRQRHASNPTPYKIYERFERLAQEWQDEIELENRLREIGRSDRYVERAVARMRKRRRWL